MTPKHLLQATLLTLAAAPLGCKHNTLPQNLPDLALKSSSFTDTIPNQFSSCEGQTNDSAELSWQSPPASTESFALIVTDPDAPIGTFTHWILYNIPPDTRELPQAVRKEEQTPNGSRQGANDFGETGYDGPCPPGNSTHRYLFDLYALDTRLNLPSGVEKRAVLDAMNNHIVAHGQLTARYHR